MCNPPGGDWSGVTLLDFGSGAEYRWTSLPRVSGKDGKRPDHVIEFARAAGQPIKVASEAIEPVPTSAFKTSARRPGNSRLDTRKLRETFGLTLPPWHSGVERMLVEVLT